MSGLAETLPGVARYVEAGTSLGQMLEYLQALLSSYSGGLLFVRSVVDGRFLLVNSSFEELVGRPAAQIVGRTSAELFDDEIAASHREGDHVVLRTGSPTTRFESSLDANGARHRYVSHKFPLIGPDGSVTAIGGLAVDITSLEDERRMQRQARFAAEARFRAVFDHAPVGQVFIGMDRKIASVNEPMATMLGLLPADLLGRSVMDFMAPEYHQQVRDEAQSLLSGGTVRVSAVRELVHRDGHKIPVRVTSALLPGADGQPGWWVTMVVDISDEERARTELQHAHTAALQAADRLSLLHAIATAANESTTLRELVPIVLNTVCDRFQWPYGALVTWPAGGGPARCVEQLGADVVLLDTLPHPDDDEPLCLEHGGRSVVVVPLTVTRPDKLALVFAGDGVHCREHQREVLSLVGSECSRVIEREAASRRLRESEARFRSVFDSSPLAMGLSVGDSGTYADVNEAMCELLGRTREQLVGMSARDLVHPNDIPLTDAAGAAALSAPDGRHRVEMRMMHSSGSAVIVDVTLAWMDGPNDGKLLLAQIEDITARRTAEDALRHQAERDSLTGLANRSYLSRELAELGAASASCAILFIDLDGFKLINDTRGHDVGDEVLIDVANRLRSAVRPSDLVARFGGDEFVVLCRTGPSAAEADSYGTARRVADRIESALAEPISTQAGVAHITASIGISGGEIDAAAPQELLQRADTAMYQAKRLGKDRRAIYDARLHERTIAYQRIEASLRNALDEDRFVLHFQPIVDLVEARILGFEALVRLLDEEGKTVPPDRFIGVAEQSGLIVPMGAWVLQESCRTVARIARLAGRPLTVSVNVAAQQAARSDLAATVARALDSAGLEPSALTLELTESALLDADDQTLQQLVNLRTQGILIGLDDFGTGYSSLTYLRRFPVTHIKVDRSFVGGMTSDSGDEAIVRAVTRLADELGLFWVAEGVETDEQREALSALGPGLGQGYLFSRPVPAGALPGLLGVESD